jgi:hypothetical protein
MLTGRSDLQAYAERCMPMFEADHTNYCFGVLFASLVYSIICKGKAVLVTDREGL